MALVPALPPPDRHIQARNADAEQDIEHRPAEAGGQRHDGVAEARDGDVGDEVAEGVADGEDGEAEDGVADAEDDAEGFEDADDFVGDGGDPGDGDGEAEEAEERAGAWGVGGGGGEEKEGEGEGGGEEGVEAVEEEGGWGEGRGGVGPEDEDYEEGGGEDLGCDEPAVPVFGGGGKRCGGRVRGWGARFGVGCGGADAVVAVAALVGGAWFEAVGFVVRG